MKEEQRISLGIAIMFVCIGFGAAIGVPVFGFLGGAFLAYLVYNTKPEGRG